MLTTLPFLLSYFSLTAFLVHADIRYGLLPDKFLCPLLWTGLLFQLCIHPDFLPSAVVGAMAGYIGFAVIYWGYRFICRREGMGYGDVKYLAALGAWHAGACCLRWRYSLRLWRYLAFLCFRYSSLIKGH